MIDKRIIVYGVEKSYEDILDARKALDYYLLRISPEFLINQIDFYHSLFNRIEARSQKYRQPSTWTRIR